MRRRLQAIAPPADGTAASVENAPSQVRF